MSELKLPQSWQDWQITEEIGEGAYGKVYRAEKDNGGVTAVSAIKIIRIPSERSELLSLRREFQSDEELRRNLKEMVDGYANEIRAMYRLQGNTHIVSIQDHAVEELDDGLSWRICIRMEYLQSFDDYAMTHSFTREDIIRLGISLCEALDVCAGSGILHRDVKPENLFVTESGQYKLGDFGIAKAMDRTVRSYSSKGTFSYMAPEVFQGKPYDTRADLYSTGIILYKLANRNRDPFIDPDKQIITQQDREQAMSLRMRGEKLPAPCDADDQLAGVILKACEFDPKNRYNSPGAMLQALRELLQPAKKAAAESKKKWILPLCAALILLIAGIVILVTRKPETALPDSGSTEAAVTPAPAEKAPDPVIPGSETAETEETPLPVEETPTVEPEPVESENTSAPLPAEETPTAEPEPVESGSTSVPLLTAEADETAVPDSENPETVETSSPDNTGSFTQEFGGVRFTLPEGFVRDMSIMTDRKAVWACGDDLLIGFQLQENYDYQPTGKGDRKIGGYDATFDPEDQGSNGYDRYVLAVYANPEPGAGGSVCIYLIGTDEDRAGVLDQFVRMLDGAERIGG